MVELLINEFQKHYAKWKKPNTNNFIVIYCLICMSPFIWNLRNDKIRATKGNEYLLRAEGLEGHEGKLGEDGNVLYPDGGGGYITEFVKTLQNLLFKLVHFLYVYFNKS